VDQGDAAAVTQNEAPTATVNGAVFFSLPPEAQVLVLAGFDENKKIRRFFQENKSIRLTDGSRISLDRKDDGSIHVHYETGGARLAVLRGSITQKSDELAKIASRLKIVAKSIQGTKNEESLEKLRSEQADLNEKASPLDREIEPLKLQLQDAQLPSLTRIFTERPF
jgi:hypothetical protein